MENKNVLKSDLKKLILKFGYWSKEVKNFNDNLEYKTMVEINLNIN